jgi:MFS family permease
MLWFISLFNYADRQAVFAVLPLLEKEMNLTTEQLGLIGSAFAWVYGLCAPFAGSIVDRVARTKAVLFGLHAWSAICLATGFARTFPQLFAFRAAEGLGETFYFPASMSLISDYHGKRTRSRAMGLHQTSVYIGTVVGGFFAGLIGQHYGWRWSFYVFGGLGVVLGLVLSRWLIEPRRGAAEEAGEQERVHEAIPSAAGISFGGFLGLLFRTPTALLLMLGFICMNFVAVVLLSWSSKFLYDRYGLSLAVAALLATLFPQFASAAGSPIGGWLADRWRLRAPGGRMSVQATAAFAAAPFVFLAGGAGSLPLCLTGLAFWGLFKGFYDANIWASLFDVIPMRARGRAVGVMNLVGWLGGGSAAWIVGKLAGSMGLGAAIASAGWVYLAGGCVLLLAARVTAPRDMHRITA